MTTLKLTYLIILLLLSSFGAIISWKLSHLFLSRRDLYTNSKYDVFMKKLGWATGIFLIIFVIGAKVLKQYF